MKKRLAILFLFLVIALTSCALQERQTLEGEIKMCGVYLNTPKQITFSLGGSTPDARYSELLDLLKKLRDTLPGEDADFKYGCDLDKNALAILVNLQSDNLGYHGPWWVEYSVIPADFWADNAGPITLTSKYIWGPKITGMLYYDEAVTVGKRVYERLEKIIKDLPKPA